MPRLTDADLERLDRLNRPAPAGAHAGVTEYLHAIYRDRPDLQEAFPDLDGPDGERLVDWAHLHGARQVPIIEELLPPRPARLGPLQSPPSPPVPEPPLGVNVIGFFNAEVGMGEAGRLVVEGLDAAGVPLLPVQGTKLPQLPNRHPFETVGVGEAGFPVNLLCTNPPGAIGLREEVPDSFFDERRSVGFWWWEALGGIPLEWTGHDERLEEVWVASRHVAEALEPFTTVPVHTVRLPVAVPACAPVERPRLGLPDGFVFLFLFDHNSTLERKNPLGAIEAFRTAFEPGSGASLVLKSTNAPARPDAHARLVEAAADHPDVHLLDGFESPARKNAMIAACDCYLSLHRAEGFGLTAAEAMYLGKPVVATGFSGNLEFMTRDNSHLVDYTVREIGPGADPYPEHGHWAEPDLEHAAALMRRVFDDPAEARRLGRVAAAEIRSSHGPLAAGDTMRRRLERFAQPDAFYLARADALVDAGPEPPARSPLGPIGRAARRLVLRLIRPYTAWQRMVNEELLAALHHSRRLKLEVAHMRARALATARGRTSAPASLNGHAVPAAANGHRPSASNGARPDLARKVESVPYWWHSIDLGHGVITPGNKGDLSFMHRELDGLCLPDLTGRTLVDVGAWDGFYSFAAERAGAARVVALDHFAWEAPQFGKGGFDLARGALGSAVEQVAADFMRMDLEELGRFDVVLFLGVLYHLQDPLGALRRLAAVTGEVAVIESEAIVVPGREELALCEFYSGDQLAGDPSNWWAPTLPALHHLCAAAGFRSAETVAGPPAPAADVIEPVHYRAVVHAYA